jgi:capsular exopolysaccharide synthesis family protein
MDAARFFALTRRWWWLVALGALLAVAAYGVMSRLRPRDDHPWYEASATLIVHLRTEPPTFGVPEPLWDIGRLMATYVEIVESDEVAGEAARDIGAAADPALSARIVGDAQLIRVRAQAGTQEQARVLLDSALKRFDTARELHGVPGESMVFGLPDVSEAPVDRTPTPVSLVLVALAGAIGAAMVAFGFEYLSDAIRDARDAEAATRLPVLATIPPHPRTAVPEGARADRYRMLGTAFKLKTSRPAPIVLAPAGSSSISETFAERYRVLRTAFSAKTQDGAARVVLFTAPRPASGTTSVAANFARAQAQAGRNVILIDADFRFAAQHAVFGLKPERGLAEVLAGDCPTGAAIRRVEAISLMMAGTATDDAAAQLDSPRLDELLDELRARYELIILDSPPALAVTDATLLAARADVTILVVRADHTARADAAEAIEILSRATDRILGVVLTGDVSIPATGFLGARLWKSRRSEKRAA